MPEVADKPSLFAVDDSSAVLLALRMTGEFAGFSCATFSDKERLIESLTQWRTQNPSRGGIALLDGMVAPGSHGIDVVQALEDAGHLARRDEVLKAGCIARGKLLAFLHSGGIDATMRQTLERQFLEGLWAGALEKSAGNIVEIFRQLYQLTLNDNPGLVRAALEGFRTNTQRFLNA